MLKTPNNEYLKSAKFVLLDEYQEYAKADLQLVYNNARASNALCYGLSATPPRRDVFATAEIFNYPLNRAITDRVVSPIQVKKLKSDYSRKKVKKYLKTEKLKKLLKIKHADDCRVKDRKTIIYLPSITFIEKFKAKINKIYPKIPVFAIHTRNSDRDEHLQDFKNKDGAAIALACRQMRVGFSDSKVYTVIYLQSGKDTIDVQQAAGRAVRIDRQNENKVGLIISFANANTSGLETAPLLIFSPRRVARRSRLELEDEEEREFIPLGREQYKRRKLTAATNP